MCGTGEHSRGDTSSGVMPYLLQTKASKLLCIYIFIVDLYIYKCTPQVEVWLNKLLDSMQSTIRHEMTEAVISYEDKPRDQWLFEPPAQVALAGTQVWWTTEVNIAFARLEEGYENALKDYYKKQVHTLQFFSLLS